MSFTERNLPSMDGVRLSLRVYETPSPKAVVMCIHGMEEHQGRYEPFAEFLQDAGYTVVTADLRGHGPKAAEVSHIAEKDGDRLLLEVYGKPFQAAITESGLRGIMPCYGSLNGLPM